MRCRSLLLGLLITSAAAAQPPCEPGACDLPNGTDIDLQNVTEGAQPMAPQSGATDGLPPPTQDGTTTASLLPWLQNSTLNGLPLIVGNQSGGECGPEGQQTAGFAGLSRADCLAASVVVHQELGICPYLMYVPGDAAQQQRSRCLCYQGCVGGQQLTSDAEWQTTQTPSSDGDKRDKIRNVIIGGACGCGVVVIVCIGKLARWLRRRGLSCKTVKMLFAGDAVVGSPSVGSAAIQSLEPSSAPCWRRGPAVAPGLPSAFAERAPVFGERVHSTAMTGQTAVAVLSMDFP